MVYFYVRDNDILMHVFQYIQNSYAENVNERSKVNVKVANLEVNEIGAIFYMLDQQNLFRQ